MVSNIRYLIIKEGLGHSNFVYHRLLSGEAAKNEVPKTKFGYTIERVTLDNGILYDIIVESNSINGISFTTINSKEGEMNNSSLEEYFENDSEDYLNTKDGVMAYYRIISTKNFNEIPLVFTDYFEVLEYLGQLENSMEPSTV